MKLTKQEVRDFATKIGIDLVGFASRDRFVGLPAEEDPFSIAPEAKSVIVIGKRITRGNLRGIEEGTNFDDYTKYGMEWLDKDYIAEGCYNLVRFIEDHGKEAVPLFPNPKEVSGFGIPVREGAPAPDVVPDFNYAATACGLGVVGLNGLFLTKRFGPRQRFQMIITEAEFESDELVTDTLCDQCGACRRACPLHAIGEETTMFSVCGLDVPVADINYSLCARCKNGAYPNYINDRAKPDRIPALCSRACMIHLEEKGLIENLFENKFRRHKTWAIDMFDKNVEPVEE